MSDHSDQGLPQGVDGHSHSGTDDLRSGSFTSPVAVNTGPSDPDPGPLECQARGHVALSGGCVR